MGSRGVWSRVQVRANKCNNSGGQCLMHSNDMLTKTTLMSVKGKEEEGAVVSLRHPPFEEMAMTAGWRCVNLPSRIMPMLD